MSERGLYRGVYSSLLDDREFRRLSPEARHVFHAMRLGREAGPGCIFQCDSDVLVSLLCGRTGYRPRVVRLALDELAAPPTDAPDKPWLFRDRDSGVVWIRNGLRHDPSANLSHPKQLSAVLRSLLSLPRCEMVDKFVKYYGIGIAYRKALGRLAKAYAIGSRMPSVPISDLRSPNPKKKEKKDSLLPPSPLGEPGDQDGTGSLTRPASDGSDGAGPVPAADTPRECLICHRTWLGGPSCPQEATHAVRAPRPVAR